MIPEIPFDPPPRNLEPANGDTHVFCVSLDQPLLLLEWLAGTLSADERARAARFAFQHDRDRFLAGRGQLREILGWLLHVEPAQLVFTYNDCGKPRLARPFGGRFLRFNLAHSDGLAVCAVSASHDVGIDVERVRPLQEVEDIMTGFFSAQEIAEWRALPAERQSEAFFDCWTRKEALVKAAGVGLSQPLNQLEVLPLSGEPRLSFKSIATPSTFSNFHFHPLTLAHGYRGTVVTGSADQPSCWKWSPLEELSEDDDVRHVSARAIGF